MLTATPRRQRSFVSAYMKRSVCFTTAVVCGLIGTSCKSSQQPRLQEAWNKINDPLRLDPTYERRFAALPLTGKLVNTPWADSYWPGFVGGIALRWHAPEQDSFTYELHDEDAVRKMSLAELAQLSPAEKYSIYLGDYDYQIVKNERRIWAGTQESWAGVCNGWAVASLGYVEPQAVLAKGPGNVEVPFGASDVKALLAYWEGHLDYKGTKSLGTRCDIDIKEFPDLTDHPECAGVNAGAWHLVLANELGRLQQGFIANTTRYVEIWNQPMSAFKAKVLERHGPSKGAATGTATEVEIDTEVTYTLETKPHWQPVLGTPEQTDKTRTYRYRLELDQGGTVIGGAWLQEDRPANLWKRPPTPPKDYFGNILAIYHQSISNPSLPDPVLPGSVPPSQSFAFTEVEAHEDRGGFATSVSFNHTKAVDLIISLRKPSDRWSVWSARYKRTVDATSTAASTAQLRVVPTSGAPAGPYVIELKLQLAGTEMQTAYELISVNLPAKQ